MWTVTENTEWEREECVFRRVAAVCLLVLPRSRIEYTSFLLCTVSSSRPLITTEPLGHRRREQGGEREIRERDVDREMGGGKTGKYRPIYMYSVLYNYRYCNLHYHCEDGSS